MRRIMVNAGLLCECSWSLGRVRAWDCIIRPTKLEVFQDAVYVTAVRLGVKNALW